MSNIDMECPLCHVDLEIPEEFDGQKVKCPSCSKLITVSDPRIARETSKKTFKVNRGNMDSYTPSPVPQQKSGGLPMPVIIGLVLMMFVTIGVSITAIVMVSQKNQSQNQQNVNPQIGSPRSANAETVNQNNSIESKKKGSIEGGAWLTKGGGQSDLLRGLTIFVLPDELLVSEVRSILTDLQEKIRNNEKFNIEQAKKSQAENSTSWAEDYRNMANTMNKAFNLIDLLLKAGNSTMKTSDIHKLVRLSNTSVFGVSFLSVRAEFDDEWNKILTERSVSKSTTGLDAKYTISNINTGPWLVYAKFAGSLEIVEWIIPVNVNEGISKLDFYNDNMITYKK